ncbi:carboxymuconolactone decarboxylase family protein [Solirubrobacter ginsenosidimutans]|uniref:Carboxymuconolactone decarboxylase family protein n=1 Tax=Solirubrobacter ginsenosidimutans TaxID=490573 RepID=A0A9X3MMV2_9ACTN|nr:carboxymuconolactone decarboxylase family protein [Solirubrobacter ginsenosidimutans]MDA0159516.1 carboxymuconolactone decarboxylase family protein [Solirubrobacter ginsenosidimutans]
MTTFTIHPGSGETLQALERNIGFIPNLAAAIAASPAALSGFVGLQTALRSTTLTGLEREVVGITVSRHNDCAYSLAAHSTFARKQGGDEPLIAALVAGEPMADSGLEALRAFTQSLLEQRGHVASELSPEVTLEVIAQVAYTTLANYAADVSGAAIDDAFRA